MAGDSAGWLAVREVLRRERWELGVAAAREYPLWTTVGGTPLLSTAAWLPGRPVPVRDVRLEYRGDVGFSWVTGAAAGVVPAPYRRYSAAVAGLARPRLFEDRPTYRLLDADLRAEPLMVFGAGSYFDGVDVGEACAHEYVAAMLEPAGPVGRQPLRRAVGDPCDPRRRRINVAVSTLTLRYDRGADAASFLVHRRDGAAVGHAGGMLQVLPVGIFQPSGTGPDDVRNDFSLWRCMVREFAEELLGEPEVHGPDGAPVDYAGWPFAARLTAALQAGQVRAHCLGIGVDPLTLATDILTTVVIDAPLYDELFGRLAGRIDEGTILPPIPFDADQVERYARREPMQAAGAALLALAWTYRHALLS